MKKKALLTAASAVLSVSVLAACGEEENNGFENDGLNGNDGTEINDTNNDLNDGGMDNDVENNGMDNDLEDNDGMNDDGMDNNGMDNDNNDGL